MTHLANSSTQSGASGAVTHTPGPWSLDKAGDVFAGDNLIAVMCGYNYGEWRDAEDGGKAEFEANARLIAAAPELLAACEKALNYIANTESEFGIELDSGDALRAAIAKATGA